MIFRFLMAICTGQYACFASFKLVQHTVDTGAFFLPEAGCAFLFVATLHCFRLENGTFSTGSTTVKRHTEANVLVVWAP